MMVFIQLLLWNRVEGVKTLKPMGSGSIPGRSTLIFDMKLEKLYTNRLAFGFDILKTGTPKVVAMAVSTVMTMFRILLQSSLFMGFMMFGL